MCNETPFHVKKIAFWRHVNSVANLLFTIPEFFLHSKSNIFVKFLPQKWQFTLPIKFQSWKPWQKKAIFAQIRLCCRGNNNNNANYNNNNKKGDFSDVDLVILVAAVVVDVSPNHYKSSLHEMVIRPSWNMTTLGSATFIQERYYWGDYGRKCDLAVILQTAMLMVRRDRSFYKN